MQEHLYNLNIERAVLSTIIFDPKEYEEIAAQLKPEDFYHPFHQHLFAAMEELFRADMPIDEEFLREKLSAKKRFDEVAFLDILGANPLSNTHAYIKEIKAKAQKRALVGLATEIKKLTIEEDMPAEDVMDRVESKLYAITSESSTQDFRESEEMALSTVEYIKKMKERGNSMLIGVDTGFKDLNRMTSGFGEGDLVIVAARPSMGKTAFTLNMALKALEKGDGVAFFSLEMPAEQLVLRLLSAKTSIALQDLRVGNLTDEEWTRLSEAVDWLSAQKLFVDDEGSLNIHQVRAKLRKLKAHHPEIKVAMIDYLQLMSGGGNKDRHQEVSEISRGLKLLARELQIPIVALSQLNRSLESRADKRPMLSDLRESGAIEQDADIILFVYRDDVYRIREEKEKEMKARAEGKEYRSTFHEKEEEDAEIIIGKQRNGPTGIIELKFQKRFTRFVDAGHVPVEIVYEQSNIDTPAETKIELPPI
ncbi:MAG: replicative DNA helicase [Hydrogenimonas sp.]|nr:replicative DNA helicase [Hydrogenimonas sp.]